MMNVQKEDFKDTDAEGNDYSFYVLAKKRYRTLIQKVKYRSRYPDRMSNKRLNMIMIKTRTGLYQYNINDHTYMD